MLENCAVERKQISVLKLSTITQSLEDDLLELRIDSINIEGSASKLAKLGETSTAEDVIDNAFRPRSEMPTPFPIGRFGDGSIAVYYAALEKRTCEQEILFHVIDELNEIPNHTRFYSLVECQYAGITTDLCGHEVNYPYLASDTKQGYPFCQQLETEINDAVNNNRLKRMPLAAQ